MVKIYATLIWLYYICHHKMWLISRKNRSYRDNDILHICRMISEVSYDEEEKR